MDNKKFEQLIDLIINENEEQARSLFHDIVVEKSREIYESMMDEELEESAEEGAEDSEEELEEGLEGADQVGGLMDEIGVEEEGLGEDDDEFADIDVDSEEGLGDEEGLGGEEGLEDRVVDLEDKLDELMAEFEELMGQEGGEDVGGEEEFGGEEDMGGDDMGGEEDFGGDEEMMEAVQLQKVSVTHGDNGVNNKSIISKGPKVSGNGAKAVNFGGESTKGGTEGGLLKPTTQDLKGAGTFKNAPGKGNFSEKGESVAKPKHGDNGQNSKSITSESHKTAKKRI